MGYTNLRQLTTRAYVLHTYEQNQKITVERFLNIPDSDVHQFGKATSARYTFFEEIIKK